MSRIKFKPRRITIAGQVPTIDQLENGEFAINTADQKIFQRVGSSVVEVSNVGVVQGTTNEIEVSTVGSTSTIGLPNDVTITGDLTVNGTTTTISTTNTVISDNLLELNSGASSNANDSGIIIERGSTGDNAIIFWDESADVFRLATTTATAASTGNLSTTDANLNVGGLTTSGNIVIPDAGTIGSASDTDAISISSGGVVNVSATTANTSASDGALTVAGGLGVAADASIGDDLRLISDSAVLSFGANSEITLTHVHNTGLLLEDSGGTPTLQLHDANESIASDGSKVIITSGGTTFNLPTSDGTSGQALVTDASGNLSFSTVTAASPLSITSASGGQINLGSTDSSITATDLIGEIVNVTGETDSGVSPAARIQIRAQQDHSSSTNESSIVFQVGRPALSNATTPAFYGFAMSKTGATPTSSGRFFRGGSVTAPLFASTEPFADADNGIFGGSDSIKSTSGGFGFGAPEWFLGINYTNDPSDDPDGDPTSSSRVYILADDDAEAEALTSGNFTVSANDGSPSETFSSEPSNYTIDNDLTAAYQKTYGSTKSVFISPAIGEPSSNNIFAGDGVGRGVDTSTPLRGVKAQFASVDRTAGLDDAMYVHRSHFDTPMVTVPNITVNKLLEMNPGSAIGLRNYCNPSEPSDFDGYGELPFPAIEFGSDVDGMPAAENNIVIQSTTANGVVFNAHGASADPAITFASQHVEKAQIYYDISDSRLETTSAFHIYGTLTLGSNSSPDDSISSDNSKLVLTSGGTSFKIPTSDGTSGQALVTDASGNLSFSTVGASSPLSITSASGGQINLGSTDSSIEDKDLIGEIVGVTGETDTGVSPAARVQIRAQEDHSSSTNETAIVFQVGRPQISNASTPAFFGFSTQKGDPYSPNDHTSGGTTIGSIAGTPSVSGADEIFSGGATHKPGGFGFGAPEWFLGIAHVRDDNPPDEGDEITGKVFILADDDAEAEALTAGNFDGNTNDGTTKDFTFTTAPSNYSIESGLTTFYQKRYGSTKSVFSSPVSSTSNLASLLVNSPNSTGTDRARGVDTSDTAGVKLQYSSGVTRQAGLDDAMYIHRSHFDTPMVTASNITVNKLLEMNPGSAIGLRGFDGGTSALRGDYNDHGQYPYPAIEFGSFISGMASTLSNIVMTSYAGSATTSTPCGVVFNANDSNDPAIHFASKHVRKSQLFYDISDDRLETDTAFHVGGALSKSSGTFEIDHPLESLSDTRRLQHSFIEGPYTDLIYRGSNTLSSGTASINIDTEFNMTEGTFEALNTNIQCFTTNESDWDAVKGSVSGNTLTITCQNSSSTATVSWMVIGYRKDETILNSELTDSAGKFITEKYKYPVLIQESGDYILNEENGKILLNDRAI